MTRFQFNIALVIFVLAAYSVTSSFGKIIKRNANGPKDDACLHPINHMKHTECCKTLQPFKVFQEIMQNCIKEVSENPDYQNSPGGPKGDHPPPPPNGKPDDKHGDPKVHMPCVKECVFNKTGMISNDGKLNKDALKSKILELLADEADMKPVIENTVESCITKVEAIDHTNHVCKSGAIEFAHCFETEMFTNCPKNKWTDCRFNNQAAEECENLKKQTQKCVPPQ